MSPAVRPEPLALRLIPVEQALQSLRQRLIPDAERVDARAAADPDVLAALDGLYQVVAELAQQKWSAG